MNEPSVLFSEQKLPVIGTSEELLPLIVKSINYSVGAHLVSPFERVIIGIAGGSGAGKSHVAERIAKELPEHNPCIVSQERFYKPNTNDINNPDFVDKELCVQTLQDIKDFNSDSIQIPGFTGPSANRISETIKCGKVAIFEGLFTLYPEYYSLLNFTIYIEALESIRFQRRISRDVELKGKSYANVHQDWSDTISPNFHRHIAVQRKFANIIIINNFVQ
jgi:uridine kinase